METTFEYTAECGCEIVQYGTVWHGDGFLPERTEVVKHCFDWVSVSEKLPTLNEPVLTIYRTDGGIGVPTIRALLSKEEGWVSDCLQTAPFNNVTHWMEIPKVEL